MSSPVTYYPPTLMFWLGYEGEARTELYTQAHHITRVVGPSADWVKLHGTQHGPRVQVSNG